MIEKAVHNWTDELIMALISRYDTMGLRASGKYAQSLKKEVRFTPGSARIKILGAKHSLFMEGGRTPNVDQSPEGLRKFVGWAGSTFLKKWVKDKNLSINPYAVAWKIAREGIKVPNDNNTGGVVSSVITEQRIGQLIQEMGFVLGNNIKSEVFNIMQEV